MILFSLVAVFLFQCFNSQPCTDPVSFNSPQFTIRGPCPKDTVLLVPVEDTVHYRCDYEDMRSGTDLPYWHVTQLSGTPFGPDEQNDYDVTVAYDSVSGSTTLSFPVKEQYLNTTLDIQCGLCSLLVCAGEDRLSEDIISASVKLVSVGPPINLHSVFNSNGIVTLSWSPPLTSADYCTNNDCFEYTVNLTDEADFNKAFYTNDTTLSINTTAEEFDQCRTFTWSVIAIANSFEISKAVTNHSIVLQTKPVINATVFHRIGEFYPDGVELFVNFSVSSLQPFDTLEFGLQLNIYGKMYFFNDDNSSVTLLDDDVTVSINTTLYHWMLTCETFFTIAIHNKCGTTRSDEYQLSIVNVSCLTVSSTYTMMSSLVTATSQLSSTYSATTEGSSGTSSTPTETPTELSISETPTESSTTTSLLVSIGISVGSVVLVTAIVLLILICILIVYKKTRKFKLNVERDANIDSTAYSAIYNGVYKSVVSDYISPVEAIDAKKQYTAAIDISTESQYCEPEQLFSSKTGTLPLPVHSHQNKPVSESGATWDSSGLEEVAGYCVPPIQDKKFKNRNSKAGSTKKKNVPMQNPAPLYADVEQMRELKSEAKNRSGYASLDLPPPSEAPPPVPLPHNPYSTIAPHESPPPLPLPFIDTEYDIIGSCEDTPPPPLDQ